MTDLSHALRTPPELAIQLEDNQKRQEDRKTASYSHVHEDGRSAMKKHGGPITTARCTLPGCMHRIRKLPNGTWIPFPIGETAQLQSRSSNSWRSPPSSAAQASIREANRLYTEDQVRQRMRREGEESVWREVHEDYSSLYPGRMDIPPPHILQARGESSQSAALAAETSSSNRPRSTQ